MLVSYSYQSARRYQISTKSVLNYEIHLCFRKNKILKTQVYFVIQHRFFGVELRNILVFSIFLFFENTSIFRNSTPILWKFVISQRFDNCILPTKNNNTILNSYKFLLILTFGTSLIICILTFLTPFLLFLIQVLPHSYSSLVLFLLMFCLISPNHSYSSLSPPPCP